MKILTEYPIATDSPDHLYPLGTANDNTTDLGFIEEVEKYFNDIKINTLDIGCAGGQLTIDFNKRGHRAIGIEGSDYSIINKRANWPNYYNICLFTCDATKPYKIIDESDNVVNFDLITAWEVLEHIHENDFENFFGNIVSHIYSGSIFCASINPFEDNFGGHIRHLSVFDKDFWYKKLSKFFVVAEMPFSNKVRYGGSFHVLCKVKK